MKTADLTPEMIDVNFPQPVRRPGWTDEGLLNLGKSLIETQLNPIYVMKNRKVVAGNSRILGSRMVKKSHLWGYMLDADLSESEQLQWMCFENVHRVEVTVQEQTKQCLRLLDLNPEWEQKQAAAFLKLDPSMISRFAAVGKTLPAAQEAFYAGTLSLSTVYEIYKAGDAAAQHAALAQALGGASREELRESRQRKFTGTVQSKVARLKCSLPGGLSVQVSGASVSLQEFIDALLLAVKEAKAALKDNQDAKAFAAVMANRAKVG